MDIYKKAFKLVGFQADNPIELLKQLSDVACHLLDLNGATDNVYYFSLPIWDYAKGEWMKEVCSCVNKKKDKEFESGSGWYKSYQDYPHTTTYARFFKDAKQNGFSFIEFMTQEVKEFIPVFTIHMEPSDAVEPTFSLEADSEELGRKLQLIGNKTDSFENEGNVNRFMETTAKLLTNNGVDSLEDKQRNDLKLLYEFLCKYQQYFGNSLTIYLISSKIFTRSDGSSIGSGGMVLVCKKAVTEEVLMQLSIVINLCYRELGGKNWEERWRKVVVGASIAQVMARNLSHNYGSHVLNHLLQPIWGTFRLDNTSSPYKCNYSGPEQDAEINETFQQIISLIKTFFGKFNDADFSRINVANYEWLRQSIDKAKEDLQNAVDNVERVTKTPVLDLNKLSNESLRQIVYLLNHIKCRVDYISDISFGVPMLETTRLVHSDIFRELDRVGLLMNHISGLEDQFQYKIILTGPRGSSLDRTEEAEAMDLKVAVPNDVVGTHAFYNILENIIRNTAKHGNTKEEVTFYINFSNISEQDLDNDAALINESKQYYCVEIHDNVCMEKTAAKILVKAQNERLNEPVFENERPRSHSLGLVEMEASAAYLRKLDSSAVDDDLFVVEVNNDKLFNHHKQFNLLKAFVKKDETGCHLGYRFFMLRPREVLMIDGPEKYHKSEEGIRTIGKDIFETDLKNRKIFNHEFVVYFDDDVHKSINAHKTALSPRVLKLESKDLNGITSSREIKELCWRKWFEKNAGKWEIEDIYCGIEQHPSKDHAIYLRHLENENAHVIFNDKEYKYVEALSSMALAKLPDFPGDIQDYHLCLKFDETIPTLAWYRNIEAVNNRVLVLDERIQDAAIHQFVYTHLLKDHYKKMNVIVPDPSEINLLEKNIEPIASNIKKYIEEACKKNGEEKSFDFVLIHYGILERVFKSMHGDFWKQKMDEFLCTQTKDSDTRIVLTSGRGVPDKLPDCVGFVSLSSVISALIDYKSKYLLNCLMYASRESRQ